MYLSEGGVAISTRAAQFIKALTRIVWRVVGRRTSLRLVQCTKVNSGISSTLVLQRSTHLSSRQLSHACAPIALKFFVRASAVIPVELRQPGASSLVLACSADPRGDGISLRVNSARLIHPWKRYCPNLASLLNLFATPSDAYTHCKEQHSAKALYPKSRQPGAKTLFNSLQSRKTLSEMPITVAGSLTMRSCRQFCQASAPMSLMPDSTLTCLRRGTPTKAPSGTISSGFKGTWTASGI